MALTMPATAAALVAFAGNSILARLALRADAIDWVSFSSLRILSGAVALWLLCSWRHGRPYRGNGSPGAAAALLLYAFPFSGAYVGMDSGTGALILFAAVQTTMLGAAVRAGERMRLRRWVGFAIAAIGLVVLLLPGAGAPPVWATANMVLAGASWGVYSLYGKAAPDALARTTGNFIWAAPLALVAGAVHAPQASWSPHGVAAALASGAVTSGIGYAVWYVAVRGLATATASFVQLAVPVIAAIGGILLLGESLTPRLLVGGGVVLAGLAAAVRK